MTFLRNLLHFGHLCLLKCDFLKIHGFKFGIEVREKYFKICSFEWCRSHGHSLPGCCAQADLSFHLMIKIMIFMKFRWICIFSALFSGRHPRNIIEWLVEHLLVKLVRVIRGQRRASLKISIKWLFCGACQISIIYGCSNVIFSRFKNSILEWRLTKNTSRYALSDGAGLMVTACLAGVRKLI